MKKLRTIIFILLASVATTSVIAAGSDFAGPYIGLRMTVAGGQIQGSASNSEATTSNGTVGGLFGATGGELGYTLPLGDSAGFVSVGASSMSGGVTIVADSNGTEPGGASNDATIEIKNHWAAYIAPGFAISDSAAFYIKGGYARADVNWEGDIQQGPKWIEGHTGAIGTKILTAAGIFIQTEAGVNVYDDVSFTSKSKGNKASGYPAIAYGALTIGMKF